MTHRAMLKTIRLTLACVLVLPLLVIAVVLALFCYTLEKEPLVPRNPSVDYTTVVAGKKLVKRINRQVESAGNRSITLSVTEAELQQLAQMGAHTFKWFNADLYYDSATIHSRLSLQLPQNPVGEYLNLGFQVGRHGEGVGVNQLSMGPLQLSGRWLLPFAAWLADAILRDKQAGQLLASARNFRIEGNSALLDVVPPPDFKANLKQAVRDLQASRFPPGEEARVVHYYDLLVGLGQRDHQGSLSFNDFLNPLMVEAAQRQASSSAVTENRAVILAFTIYFSNGAFEVLVGKLVSLQRTLARSPAAVTLGGRRDLLDHFIYSAGITLATQQGISIAAGEFKELLDSGNGGSGFSFADLAADRAGIKFVVTATASEAAARQLQQGIVANNRESAFFPTISGLVEGLSEEQYRQQFGSIQSARYRQQVGLIDQRIARLPAYQ